MSIAAATIRMRPARGPALGKVPLPVTATVVSGILHVVLAIAVVLGARAWSQSQPKTYVVNLVPAVAAVGSPQGQTTPAPTLPPRPEEAARPEPPRPTELPQRETPRSAAAPEMPPRARELPSLPERASLPRPSATPRAGDKELPAMTGPSTPKAMPDRVAPDTVARAAPPPPAPLGRADGSPQGLSLIHI